MNITNITNPVRKIAKYLGTDIDFSKVEIVDNVNKTTKGFVNKLQKKLLEK